MSTTCHKKRCRKLYHPLIPGVLLAVIPKCPFCVLAYGGALGVLELNALLMEPGVMCSVEAEAAIPWMWYVLLSGLIVAVWYALLRNRQGVRTYVALTLAVMGTALIVAHLLGWVAVGYMAGALLILVAAMLNSYFLIGIGRWLARNLRHYRTRLSSFSSPIQN